MEEVSAHMRIKKEPLEVWILREFTKSKTNDILIMRARAFIFLLLRGHMLPDMTGSLIRVRFRGCSTDRKSSYATSDLGLVAYSYIALLLHLVLCGAHHLISSSFLRISCLLIKIS
ncbi:hypothetical protein M9H77_05021 [Catharanthus roseus]|uniref:Uncharacterized protein n=1 Tax=Catharanthus roseus TaxID=4058 RepID=A0ACC0CG48_CATRO|nr:hypothetical protein M9H77_05021 [Catharanthus roseus]